jgi:hypothetical protein
MNFFFFGKVFGWGGLDLLQIWVVVSSFFVYNFESRENNFVRVNLN